LTKHLPTLKRRRQVLTRLESTTTINRRAVLVTITLLAWFEEPLVKYGPLPQQVRRECLQGTALLSKIIPSAIRKRLIEATENQI
jgi:hypothetical protein